MTRRATSCSTTPAPRRTSRGSSSVRTARTCLTSCARTSRSSSGCPSAGRGARAARTAPRPRARTSRPASTRSRPSTASRRCLRPGRTRSVRAAVRGTTTRSDSASSFAAPSPMPCSPGRGARSPRTTRATTTRSGCRPRRCVPGTIFADPYGHVLVVAQRVAQTAAAGGILLAVDGQPDGTVARKRFWRGNFLFAIDPALGSAGFKRFRPVVRDAASGQLRRLKNAELADCSIVDQYDGGVEGSTTRWTTCSRRRLSTRRRRSSRPCKRSRSRSRRG